MHEMADIWGPAQELPIDPRQQGRIIRGGAGDRIRWRIGVEGRLDPLSASPSGDGMEVAQEVLMAARQVMPATRDLHQAEQGSGELPHESDRGRGFAALGFGLVGFVLGQGEDHCGQRHLMLGEVGAEALWIRQVAHPGEDRFDPAESCGGGDRDHVRQAFALPSHVPGVDFAAEVELVGHGEVSVT
jgi:hypothetical protein